MKNIKKHLAITAAILSFTTNVHAGDTSLTIYSTATPGSISPDMYRPLPGGLNYGWTDSTQIPGYAVIREQRQVDLKEGRSDIKFSDVAAYIDPTTVSFKSLSDPSGTSVIEQDYHFDLVNSQKLLGRYTGEKITVEQNNGDKIESFNGKLLSASGGLIIQDQNGKVTSINNYSNIRFPELPGGLITKPTLIWDVITDKPGTHDIETSYQTGGITWWSDYNAIYEEGGDANNGFLDLGAWVSIVNKSGAGYENAKLKLIAGDVNRVQNQGATIGIAEMRDMSFVEKTEASGFAEKSFFEFHLYTLGRPTTIPDNSTKQIELFPKVTHIPVEKQFVYYGAANLRFYGYVNTNRDLGVPTNKKVDVYLKFKNGKKNGMGIPLPSGRVRVSKMDKEDGSLEFIGEDIIDHTPKDEEVLIKMGSAFDITGERKQTNFYVDNNRNIMEESFEIAIRNHKDEDVNVLVKENMYRSKNWQIISNTGKFEKIDAHTVHFPVIVKKDGEAKIQYTVRYTW